MGSHLNVAIALISFLIGIYLYTNWAQLCTQLRGKTMALSIDSATFESWKRLPFPVYLDVYMFNWTNSEAFLLNSTIRPSFTELGPYRFHETMDKVDIVWNEHNHTVSYRKKALFAFDPENSNGTLDDMIVSVNTVAHAAALRVKNASLIHKVILERTLRIYEEQMTVTKTVNEWLFAGYADPLVTMGNLISIFTKEEVPFERVGWMFMRNNSANYEGHFNMFTGTDDIQKMGQIHQWNYQTHSNAFRGDCGRVHGSLGEFFPPNLQKHDTIWLYVPNICRAVPLDYVGTTTIHGLTTFKFSGTLHAVDNGTWYPETECLCSDELCEYSGVFSISRCKYNSSIYMSYPHFYKADSKYLSEVEGLQPDQDKHELFIAIEPYTGLPMAVSGGFQANYMLEPVPGVRPFRNIKKVLIPLMWAEERVQIPTNIAEDIALVPLAVVIGQSLGIILMVTGSVILCWYVFKIFVWKCQSRNVESVDKSNIEIVKNDSRCKLTSHIDTRADNVKCTTSFPLAVIKHSESAILLSKSTKDNISNG